jgi:hypothetical protein
MKPKSKSKPSLPPAVAREVKRSARSVAIPTCKSATMCLRISPEQKAAIMSDAEALGISATELLLQLHLLSAPVLRKEAGK